MAYKVFLDTNIFLDHLLDRNIHSSELLKLCEEGNVHGFTSASSFYTISYVIRKSLSSIETRKALGGYLRFVSILATQKSTLRNSLDSAFNDLEDAFQYFTALEDESLDFFVTNNVKDFQKISQQLPVVSPRKFVDSYKV